MPVPAHPARPPADPARPAAAVAAAMSCGGAAADCLPIGEDDGEREDQPCPTTSTSTASRTTAPRSRAGAAKEPGEVQRRRRRSAASSRRVSLCASTSRYTAVGEMAERLGMRLVEPEEDWAIFWTDSAVSLERAMELKRYQKINHFPRMAEICRKDLLARNLGRLLKQFPHDYDFFPRSWVLPTDYAELQAYMQTHRGPNHCFISKPAAGAQGKGIRIVRQHKEVHAQETGVVQVYIQPPLLLDGFKFDLRLYVLVTSCDPFRIFLYKDGLARLATVKYAAPNRSNQDNMCQHLTNYSLNKFNENFVPVNDEDTGSKRKVSTIKKWLAAEGHDVTQIWADIGDVIVKTLLSADVMIKHNYRAAFPHHANGSGCFEVLGFDLLLDHAAKPWLIEVNHTPSFHCDSPLDKEIKEGVIHDALQLLHVTAADVAKARKQDAQEREARILGTPTPHKKKPAPEKEARKQALRDRKLTQFEDECCQTGGYTRLYPNGNEAAYARFLASVPAIFGETATSKARLAAAREMRGGASPTPRKKRPHRPLRTAPRSRSASPRPQQQGAAAPTEPAVASDPGAGPARRPPPEGLGHPRSPLRAEIRPLPAPGSHPRPSASSRLVMANRRRSDSDPPAAHRNVSGRDSRQQHPSPLAHHRLLAKEKLQSTSCPELPSRPLGVSPRAPRRRAEQQVLRPSVVSFPLVFADGNVQRAGPQTRAPRPARPVARPPPAAFGSRAPRQGSAKLAPVLPLTTTRIWETSAMPRPKTAGHAGKLPLSLL